MNPFQPFQANRREFLRAATAAATAGIAPMSLVKLAFADPALDFTFGYISDAHIQHVSGTKFVRNWDRGLIRAVAETNMLTPKPDFVVFGGDLGQLGMKEELDHGAEMLSKLRGKLYCVMGEHDYYLDLGEYWSKLFGPHYYSFDHKGVHFVVLNSILTFDEWTFNRWPSAEQRMLEMAGLDNPNGSPFMWATSSAPGSRPTWTRSRRRRRSWSSRTRRCRSSTRAGTSGPTTRSRSRRCSRRSTRST